MCKEGITRKVRAVGPLGDRGSVTGRGDRKGVSGVAGTVLLVLDQDSVHFIIH